MNRRHIRLALAWAVCIPLVIAWLWLLVRGSQHVPAPLPDDASAGAIGTSGGGAALPTLSPVPPLPAPPAPPASAPLAVLIADLRQRNLRVPIDGADAQRWKGSFQESHFGHRHEAVDILAPRDTPIHAVADGRIAKLFVSKAGGLTVYQLDASQRYIYYYAHLDRYAQGLHGGDAVSRGQVIGYVGTSGNAPANTPHLHFTIFSVADPRRWWEGTAVDPYEVYAERR